MDYFLLAQRGLTIITTFVVGITVEPAQDALRNEAHRSHYSIDAHPSSAHLTDYPDTEPNKGQAKRCLPALHPFALKATTMQYELIINIDQAGLDKIHANGQYVTLSQSVNSSLNIAWITFQPCASNSLTWQEEYEIYASTTTVQPGACPVLTAQTGAAQTGYVYALSAGSFTGEPGGQAGAYNALNKQGESVTVGLARNARVNGEPLFMPLNAVSVSNGGAVSFTPEVTVYLYLSQCNNSGTIISPVNEPVCAVTLTSANPMATLLFCDATHMFYLA